DHRHDIFVRALAEIAERGVQVGGADENAVDAVDRGHRFDMRERLARLDLDQRADLVMRVDVIVLHAAEARGARAAGDAAHARVGKTRVRDGGSRFLNRVYLRDQERLNADVEITLDGDTVIPRYAYDRRR